MSQLRSYKHVKTGKVGQYSDAVARLFPSLQLVGAPLEDDAAQAFEPAIVDSEDVSSVDEENDSPRKKSKREVAA